MLQPLHSLFAVWGAFVGSEVFERQPYCVFGILIWSISEQNEPGDGGNKTPPGKNGTCYLVCDMSVPAL